MILKINNNYVEGSTQDIVIHLEKLMYEKHRCVGLVHMVRGYNSSFRLTRAIELARICGLKVMVIQ